MQSEHRSSANLSICIYLIETRLDKLQFSKKEKAKKKPDAKQKRRDQNNQNEYISSVSANCIYLSRTNIEFVDEVKHIAQVD